jgi:hypothetical protein
MTSRPAVRRSAATLALAVGVVAALVLAVVAWPTARAAPATRHGNDISWPQCSRAQGGYGLPMPPDSAGFVVIGLTKGLPFTVNPCLAHQVAWATARSKPAQAYTMAAFPTAAQLSAHGAKGPWAGSTRTGRLANTGYQEASYALARLASARFSPRMMWVDVEPRSQQPWPVGTRAREAGNRAVLTGLVRRLDEAGLAYGFYSNASGWASITGRWRTPGVPAWVTVGPRTASAALAACSQASFSGGPPHLAQRWDTTRDYDITCPAYRAAGSRPWPLSGPGDLDGDWRADLLGRDRASGILQRYPSGTSPKQAGIGWQAMDRIVTVGDLSGDGVPDVLARERGTGILWLYPRSASAGWLARRSVGSGWGGMNAVVGMGDLSGDGVPDVLARQASTGSLWLYRGTARGSLARGTRVGSGWNGFDTLLGPGDVDGDGRADLLARKVADGSLWLYPGDGAGGWLAARRIGVGWGVFDLLAAPGDLTGDAAPDVVAREPGSGRLWVYPTNGTGGWRPRLDRGTQWITLDILT